MDVWGKIIHSIQDGIAKFYNDALLYYIDN